jgi:hypothetical protein
MEVFIIEVQVARDVWTPLSKPHRRLEDAKKGLQWHRARLPELIYRIAKYVRAGVL